MPEPRSVELASLLEIARRGAASPAEMVENYDVTLSYMSSRLTYMNRWGWVDRRKNARGMYELTEEGMELLLGHVRGLSLELIIAARMVFWEWSAGGMEDRLVLRFRDGSFQAFHVEGAASIETQTEIDLGLELLSSWPSAEAVENHLDRVRPEKEQD